MTIVCLGWGSLIDDPRGLPIDGRWRPDGPDLPVEFARQSRDDRLTLVLVEGARLSTTLWSVMTTRTLDEAVAALGTREGCKANDIGRWPTFSGQASHYSEIGQWASQKDIAGVVWTALPAGFKSARGIAPTLDAALDHLRSLDASALAGAANYIRTAPPQTQTEFRPHLEAELDRLLPR